MANSFWDRAVAASKAKPKKAAPKPKAKPKPKVERQIVRAVRTVGAATKAPAKPVARAATRAASRAPKVDPEYARIRAQVDKYEADKKAGRLSPVQRVTGAETAGFDPSRLVGGDGRSIGGFLQNLGRGGLDILVGTPASAQLVGEAVVHPIVGGFNALTGNRPKPGRGGGNLGQRITRGIEEQTGEDLRRAVQGVKADYSYRYGPLAEGNVGEFGARFYDDPLPTILDVVGAKAVVGRTPNVVARATRAVAPESRAGMRASRSLSVMSAAEREAFAGVTGQKIKPGDGGRYRPPRTVTSRVAREEPGKPNVGERTREVPRAAYSGDAFARARQKGVDKVRAKVGPKIERAADRRQLPAAPSGTRQPAIRTRLAAAATRPLTPEAKYARVQRSDVREIQDLFRAKAEVEQARTMPAAARAISKLKRDKNVAGVALRGLSIEEAAFALHRMDMLGEVKGTTRGRGGLTARQLRDKYVERIEGGQRLARKEGKRTENARAQLEVLRQVPDELLDLTDMSNPSVRRVAAAVEEARKLGTESQRKSVEAGVVTAKTAAEAASRDSAIGVGGQRWGADAIRAATVTARRKTLGIKRRMAAAQKRGDKAEVKRLRTELARHVANTKGRIAAIRKDATKETPELQKAREAAREADEALKAEKGKVAGHKTLRRLYGAGRTAGKAEVRLKGAAKMKTSPRRQPPLPRKGERLPMRAGRPGEARPKGITPGQGKQYAAKMRGEGTAYKIRMKAQGASGEKISAATRARDRHFARLRRMEREALGFTKPRRPELVGKQGVYVPDRRVDVAPGGYTGAKRGGRFSGPDRARQSKGSLKARAGMDLNPALVLHQAARAAENYTGTISAKALDELISTAAYVDPRTGKWLTGDRLKLLSAADSERVTLVHQGNLAKALKKLDELEEGKFLDDATLRTVFTDNVPEGARASDYIAISRDAADVWTESMTRIPVFDKALNLWKGGLLALSPRWYVNNAFGLALQYGVMAGTDIRSIVQANRNAGIRRAMEQRNPNTVKDTMAADLTGGRDIPSMMAFGFKVNAKLEEAWRRTAYLNRAKRRIRDEGGKFRGLSEAEIARAIESMPESMARDIVRDIDFFIGNYRKFGKTEREILKRVVPFYSWARVIARLTFGLPFRSPIRAAAMGALETASTAGINPHDKSLPYYMRGSLRVGSKAIPTWGINPFQTFAPAIAAAGARQPGAALAEEGLGWVRPEIQFGVSQATGVNNFGRGVSTPPGTSAFGQDPESFNQITGLPQRQAARVPFLEGVAQTVAPGQVSVARRVFAGNRTPYDTVTTAALANDFVSRLGGNERSERLYQRESSKKGRVPSAVNPFTAPFGLPIYEQDDKSLTREAKAALREFKAEQRKQAAKRRAASR